MLNEESEARLQDKIIKKNGLMIGIKSLDDVKYMRNISPDDINHLISFRGIVIRCS